MPVKNALVALSVALFCGSVAAPSATADEAAAFAAKYGITYPWPLAEDDDQPRTVEIVTESQTLQGTEITNQYIDGSLITVLKEMVSIRQRPLSEQEAISAWIISHQSELPPPFLMEAARIVFNSDKREAAELFSLGLARVTYDTIRCKDNTALSAIQMTRQATQQIASKLKEHPDLLAHGFRTTAANPELFTHDASSWWACSHGLGAMMAVSRPDGDGTISRDNWLMPEAEWEGFQNTVLNLNIKSAESIEADIADSEAAP